jgi:hypothetical protein
MKHSETAICEYSIDDMEIISRKVLSKQFIDIVETTLAANFERAARY